MINRVVLVGRLTRDPELRKTNNDKSVASFTLAVDNRGKGADGQKTASFIPVTVWNEQAENVAKYVRKGSLVGIEGRLQQRTFDKKDGTKGNVLEVIADSVQFLEPKGANKEGSAPSESKPTFNDTPVVASPKNESSNDDGGVAEDDLPF